MNILNYCDYCNSCYKYLLISALLIKVYFAYRIETQ